MRVLALGLCLLPSSLFAAAQGYDQALAALKAYTADPQHRYTEGFEDRLNNLASQLVNSGKTQAAVTVVQINAETHPTSWQTFDSLGEGYQLLHDNSHALAAYQRSLELNPSNAHAKQQIDTLQRTH